MMLSLICAFRKVVIDLYRTEIHNLVVSVSEAVLEFGLGELSKSFECTRSATLPFPMLFFPPLQGLRKGSGNRVMVNPINLEESEIMIVRPQMRGLLEG